MRNKLIGFLGFVASVFVTSGTITNSNDNSNVPNTTTYTYTYSSRQTGDWSLTNFTDKSTYYLVPSGSDPSIASFPIDFTSFKKGIAQVTVTLNIAAYGSGTNPSAQTFSLYSDSSCSSQLVAEQSGTLPTSATYTDAIYTIDKDASKNLGEDGIFLKIVKPGKQVRLKQITIAVEEVTATDHTVKFNVHGHGTAPDDQTIPHGSLVVKPDDPSATGYTFNGWYKEDTFDTEWNFSSDTVEADVELHAKWTPNSYNITYYDKNGSSFSGTHESGHPTTHTYGTATTLKNASKTGYTFGGWHKSADCSDASITSIGATDFSSEVKLYTDWTAEQHTITLVANPTDGGTLSGGGTYSYGTKATLSATPNAGYTFDGWYNGDTLISSSNPYDYTVNSTLTITGKFTKSTYNITLTANPTEGGTVSGGGSYTYEQTATLTAIANTGYRFDGFYIGSTLLSNTSPYDYTVTESKSITAKFTQLQQYTISGTADPIEGGSITGTGTYYGGTEVSLVATSNPHYTFDGWYEDSSKVSDDAIYTFSVSKNRILIAKFKIEQHTVSVTTTPTGGGTVTGAGTYDHGAKVVLTATPSDHYKFDGWFSGSTSLGTTTTLTINSIDSDYNITAKFSVKTYSITLSVYPIESGTVSGGGTFNYNEEVTATASPNSGYLFDGWYEDSSKVSGDTSYKFNADKDRTLVAKFTQETYTLSVVANPTEGGSVTGGGTYNYGDKATLTAAPNTGYSFVGFYDGTTELSKTSPYEYTVTSSKTLTAKFSLNTYSVSLIASPVEGGSVTGSGTYNHGDSVTVIATPNVGYTFDGWYEDSSKVSGDTSYKFNADKNRTLVAKFTQETYTLTIVVDPNEGGSVTGSGTYNYGDKATLTAAPNTGYSFVGFYDGTTELSKTSPYEYTVTSSKTLTAKFSLNSYLINVSAEKGGTATGGGSYNHGDHATVIAIPNPGYSFDGWYESLTKVSSETSYTFEVSQPRTLIAKFTQETYALTITVDPNEGGSVTGSGTYNYGDKATLTATPKTGYSFVGFYDGEKLLSKNAKFEYTVYETKNLIAKFEINKYTITWKNYDGTTLKTDMVEYGKTPAYKGETPVKPASETEEFAFSGWSPKIEVVTGDATYTAQFVSSERKFEVKFDMGGHGTQISTIKVLHDGRIEKPADPTSDGFKFGGWYKDSACTQEWNFESDKVTKDTTLYAKWVVAPVSNNINIPLVASLSSVGGASLISLITYLLVRRKNNKGNHKGPSSGSHEGKNVSTRHTIDEYNRKYRSGNYRLMKFSKDEIAKLEKHNFGNKEFVLKGRRWWLINNSYCEIPRLFTSTWFRNILHRIK